MNSRYIEPPPELAPKPPYKEPMPVAYACPPSGAMPLTPQKVMRFATIKPITENDFYSYAKNNLPCPNNKVCDWVACSFFLPTIAKHKLSDLRKYPNLRHKTHLAYINVDQNSGPAEIKSSGHVSIWLHESFYPEQCVAELIVADDYEAA